MKLAALAIVWLAVTLAQVSARDSDHCYSYDNDPYLFMGTKTAYQFVYGRTRIAPVPNCAPVQIWLLARHGTRYPGRKAVTQLSTLPKLRDQIIYNHDIRGNGRMCEADLQQLRNWAPNVNLTDTMANILTPQGEQDMRLFAKRLQSQFYEILRPDPQNFNAQTYKFQATQSQRTQASMEAFMEALFNSKRAVPAEYPSGNDSLLQAYKNCPYWERSIAEDQVHAESDRFILGQEYQNLLRNVSQRLGFIYTINNDSVQLMYDMCRYEKAWNLRGLSAWCTVFSQDELRTLEYLEDLDYYYYTGPGRDINSQLGCPLLKDMFSHFRNLETGNFANEQRGIFYFTHTVTLQSFLAALGIGKDPMPLLASNYRSMNRRSFRTSFLSSFGSNIVAVFYRCGDPRSPNKVMFYADEAPVMLDGCSVGLCDWEFLKEKFGQTASECSLAFCDKSAARSSLAGHGALLVLTVLAIGRFAL